MAIDTIDPKNIEPGKAFRLMALHTIGSSVWSQKGEPAILMDFRNIIYEP
jgi:hypothetical protein